MTRGSRTELRVETFVTKSPRGRGMDEQRRTTAARHRQRKRGTIMTRIIIRDLTFGFDVPLFERLNATFDAGWTGLVGANGSGKTTLLGLIAGELSPLEGNVRRVPDGTLAWCRQESHEPEDELRAFALEQTKSAARWRGLLGVERGQLEHFERLSPGERKRWQLAWALAREPDVLLLDEPTNHLDAEARALITEALRRFSGTGILVSHDRALLEAITSRTGRIHRRDLDLYPGAYTAAQAAWAAERRTTVAARAALKQEQARLARRADERRRRAASADRDRSPARRMKGPRDHDARSMLAKNQAETASRRLAREATALDSRVARVQAELGALHVEKEIGRELFADYVPWSKPLALRVRFDALSVGTRRLLGPVALDVARSDKLAIVARNGSGKTSFLAELARQNPQLFAQSVYLAQSLGPGAQHELEGRLAALDPIRRGRVFGFVAALGSDPDAVSRSPVWSPGQARKVALGLGLAAHAPALILDEPSNHFDLPSIERLERLLAAFPGCVVLITHDEALAARVATRRFGIEDGELVEHAADAARSGS